MDTPPVDGERTMSADDAALFARLKLKQAQENNRVRLRTERKKALRAATRIERELGGAAGAADDGSVSRSAGQEHERREPRDLEARVLEALTMTMQMVSALDLALKELREMVLRRAAPASPSPPPSAVPPSPPP